MRIAQIVPGTGGAFYCENCARDVTLIKALRELGHDAFAVPVYLPLFSDDPSVSGGAPIFFGAVRTYLRQKHAFFAKLPRWTDRFFDAPWLLNLAMKKAGTTRAGELEEMTFSMLMGETGPHGRELDNLVEWLGRNGGADVAHLSNALLVGLAGRIKEKLKMPVVCSLQDEHQWVDAMREEPRGRIWRAISEKARNVDAFIAVSRFYAETLSRRAAIEPGKIHVVPIGVEPRIFHQAPLIFSPPTIGFVSRLSESMGLGAIVEAFIRLKSEPGLKALKLRVTGGHTADDAPFIASLRLRLANLRIEEDVDFILDFDRKRRLDFLQSLSVFSLPMPEGPAFGLPALEALASGVPVVAPDIGAFRELLDATGGGILYDPSDIGRLVEALKSLLLAPEKARQMGREARKKALEIFSDKRMAEETLAVYAKARKANHAA